MTRGLLGSVAERGLDRAELLAAAEITEADLAVTDSWIPIERHVRLGAAIAARLPGENLGLQTGLRIFGDPRGALGYVLRRSRSHASGLENFAAYLGVVNRALLAELETDGRFVLQMLPALAALGHPAEALFSAWVAISRHITSNDWVPSRVEFEHLPQGDSLEHRAFFRCPVEFGRSRTCLSVPLDVLELPVAPVAHELEPALRQATEEARSYLGTALRAGLDHLVGHLTVPPLLVRASHPEDGSMRDIALELARRLLAHSRLCAYEVTFLLGFGDLSVFERAYFDRFGVHPTPSA